MKEAKEEVAATKDEKAVTTFKKEEEEGQGYRQNNIAWDRFKEEDEAEKSNVSFLSNGNTISLFFYFYWSSNEKNLKYILRCDFGAAIVKKFVNCHFKKLPFLVGCFRTFHPRIFTHFSTTTSKTCNIRVIDFSVFTIYWTFKISMNVLLF